MAQRGGEGLKTREHPKSQGAGERGGKMAKIDYPQDSLTRIGQRLGVSASEALTMLSAAEASYQGKGCKWTPDLRGAVHLEVVHLYGEAEFTAYEIQRRLGLWPRATYGILAKHSVKTRDVETARHLNRNRTRPKICIHGELAEVLDGELLGDGHVGHYIAKTASFSYGTSKHGYLHWLVGILGSHGIDGPAIHPHTWPDGRTTYQWCSRRSVSLAEVRRRWYPDGKKRVPTDLLLTPTVCRHWFIGDGGLYGKHNRPSKFIRIHTNGFALDEVRFLCRSLANKGIRASACPTKKGPVIDITGVHVRRFLDYIGPCPPSVTADYGYKWQVG